MAERTTTGLLSMMLEPTPAVAMTLPAEVREKLAELELELSEGGFVALKTTSLDVRAGGPDSFQDHRPFI